MSRKKPTIEQAEIEQDGKSIAASPGRIPELHALGLESKDIERRSMEWRKKDAEKRQEIAALMEKLGISEYDCDGVGVWLEKGKQKVKVSVKEPEEVF